MATNDPTTNYEFELPDVGADAGAWGTALNRIFGAEAGDGNIGAGGGIDALLKTGFDGIAAAMPLGGGVFTGDVEYAAGARLIEDDAVMGALEVDWALGNFFSKQLANGPQTFTFANYPDSGKVQFITIYLKQGAAGTSTITWPAAVDWQDGEPPTLSNDALGVDVIVFFTRDGGSNVIGAHSISEPS